MTHNELVNEATRQLASRVLAGPDEHQEAGQGFDREEVSDAKIINHTIIWHELSVALLSSCTVDWTRCMMYYNLQL